MSVFKYILRVKDLRRNIQDPARRKLSSKYREMLQSTGLWIDGGIYFVETELGRGGFSYVCAVVENESDRRFALKVTMAEDEESSRVLEREINYLKELKDNPRVIQLLRHSRDDRFILMIMELGAETLQEHISKGRNQWKDIYGKLMHFWSEILNGVNAIHEKGFIHMDLKLENFVFAGGILKIIDFGVALKLPPNEVQMEVHKVYGTEGLSAPECYESKIMKDTDGNITHISRVSQKCDVWSLGIILLEMIEPNMDMKMINSNLHIKKLIKTFDISAPQLFIWSLQLCLIKNPSNRGSVQELSILRRHLLKYQKS